MSDPNELIAPCGLNCGVCGAYLAHTHNLPKKRGRPRCSGCRPTNRNCACIRRRCEKIAKSEIEFCYECNAFPCHAIHLLEERYSAKWSYSVVENLKLIKAEGAAALVERDRERFRCAKCGDTTAVHNGKCYSCDVVEKFY